MYVIVMSSVNNIFVKISKQSDPYLFGFSFACNYTNICKFTWNKRQAAALANAIVLRPLEISQLDVS